MIIYRQTREEQRYLSIPRSAYEERKARSEARIQKVLEYIHAEHTCRTRILLEYFGEKIKQDCGTCDICIAKHASGLNNARFHTIEDALIQKLGTGPLSIEELTDSLTFPTEQVLTAIRFLTEHDPHFHLSDNLLSYHVTATSP